MAVLRYKDIKTMNKEEIDLKLEELKKELVKQNTQRSTGTPLKNSGTIKEMRKAIARILTYKNKQKEKITAKAVNKEEKKQKTNEEE